MSDESQLGGDTPFVGRSAELGAVERALSRLHSGRGGVVAVTGEPGIGKTRLLDELTRMAAVHGYPVARGWAGELERDIPYAAITRALDPLLGEVGARPLQLIDEAQLAELAELFPSLGHPRVDAGPLLGVERYRLFAAVRAILAVLVRRRPLVVALDDLHWADGGSIELLGYLLHRPPPGPVLLTLAYRPRQVSGTLVSAIDATPTVTRLPQGPLPTSAMDRLLDPTLSAAARAKLYAASGGNPLYLQALARSGQQGSAGIGLPEQVRRVMRRELDTLPAEDRKVALLAAVIGDVVRPEILAEVAQVPERQVLATLDEMTARDLVRETEVPGELRFRHPVLRQVVYESVPPGQRLLAHRRAATVLAARGVPLIERAHHVERAAAPGDAAAAGLLAEAARSTLARAPATAVRWYEAALRLLPERDDTSATRLALLLAYADALVTSGRLPDAIEVLLAARSLPAAGDPAFDVRLVGLIGQAYNLLGRHDRAAELITMKLTSRPDLSDRESVALTLELAQVAFWRRNYPAMRSLARQVLTEARCLGADPLAVSAAAQLAFAEYQLGRTADALGYLAQAACTVDALPDEVLTSRLVVLTHLGHAEIMLGRDADGLRHLDRGLVIARRTGQGYLVPLFRCNRTLCFLYQGRLAEAVTEAQTALEGAQALDNDMFRTMALVGATWAARDSGDPVAAVRYGEQALAAARGLSTMATVIAGLLLAEALLDLGAPERALGMLLTAAGGRDLTLIAPPHRPRGYALLVRAELARGQVEVAQGYAELAADCPIAEFPVGRLHTQRTWAEVRLMQGRHDEALVAATAALSDAQETRMPLEAARSRLLLGRVLVAAGHHEQAVLTLTQAEADLATIGARRDRDLAARELRTLGLAPQRRFPSVLPRVPNTSALSRRERQVAELAAAGRTNRQIATQLHITENTVETHLKRSFAKLNVSSRAALATLLSRLPA
ncbi:MAG: helix-turn-helix transcriptional regulator [Pseudonocardiaceae bacterium]